MKNRKTTYIILWMLGLVLNCMGQTTPTQADTLIRTSAISSMANDSLKKDSTQLVGKTAISSATLHKEDAVNDSIAQENSRHLRAIAAPADTVKLNAMNDSIVPKQDIQIPKKKFVPDPQRALWLSLVFPGAGQIYNRKYWKLPLIYGGFLGCTYALLWNQQMYMDYSQAYLDIMDNDPNTDSYKDMLPPRYDITGQEERFKKIFKNKKDHFRRYRDLSAFCFVGVYLLSVVDAYVDAQLSEFDITPDLSLRIEPAVISQKGISNDKNAYGVGCSFNF